MRFAYLNKSSTTNTLPLYLFFKKISPVFLNSNRAIHATTRQTIRPFTISRKNFVLIKSSNDASAMIYSLVKTAKANCLNEYKYFELLLTEIPIHMDDTYLDFIDNLLSWNPSVQQDVPVVLRNLKFSTYNYISISAPAIQKYRFLLGDGTRN